MNNMATVGNNSLSIGIFTDSGNKIAFTHMTRASPTLTYLADFFVLKECRDKGISK
ncbi:MAG: hypothetical protein ACI9VO_001592 [Colwellia sp.]|jgi:hypothetical protein